ncbi:MAG: hypothetical protein DWH97_11630 [Planctomycetota bacterium]|nr:MAG: hypothetical protein DWH97_11630 [Planctomycetota bacterium]
MSPRANSACTARRISPPICAGRSLGEAAEKTGGPSRPAGRPSGRVLRRPSGRPSARPSGRDVGRDVGRPCALSRERRSSRDGSRPESELSFDGFG